MVHIFKDKLSIEIETKYPIDEYLQLKEGLYNVLRAIDNDLCNTEEMRPVIFFLRELELSYEQMKQLTK